MDNISTILLFCFLLAFPIMYLFINHEKNTNDKKESDNKLKIQFLAIGGFAVGALICISLLAKHIPLVSIIFLSIAIGFPIFCLFAFFLPNRFFEYLIHFNSKKKLKSIMLWIILLIPSIFIAVYLAIKMTDNPLTLI